MSQSWIEMVFFSCDACNESLKKNQVEKHTFRCRSNAFSCIDCQKVFDRQSYASHIKCISEDQKYGGKNFVQKENKGEVKQNAWCEQVERAMDCVEDKQLKQLLSRIQGFGNIPRKEAKFVNFLVNSIKIRDRNLCLRAWNAIAEEAKKMKEKEDADNKEEEEKKKNGEEKGVIREKDEDEGEGGEDSRRPFKWKTTIKRKMKENGGEMRVKKLRLAVMEEWRERGGEGDLDEQVFNEKLAKAGVTVDGKKAILA